jgi:hypothetical protein
VNPGFEDGVNNWDLYGTCSIDSEAHSGTKALKLSGGLSGPCVAMQDIAFTEADVSLIFSCYGKVTSGGENIIIKFYSDDACTDVIRTGFTHQFTDNSAFRLTYGDFTTPSGIRKIRIEISYDNRPGEYAYIDDLILFKN